MRVTKLKLLINIKRIFIYNLVRSARYAALRTRSLPAGVSYFDGFYMYRWNSRASSHSRTSPNLIGFAISFTCVPVSDTLLTNLVPINISLRLSHFPLLFSQIINLLNSSLFLFTFSGMLLFLSMSQQDTFIIR